MARQVNELILNNLFADVKESIKLDASLSVDPDQETSGASSLHYAWYCVKGKKILPMIADRLAGKLH